MHVMQKIFSLGTADRLAVYKKIFAQKVVYLPRIYATVEAYQNQVLVLFIIHFCFEKTDFKLLT